MVCMCSCKKSQPLKNRQVKQMLWELFQESSPKHTIHPGSSCGRYQFQVSTRDSAQVPRNVHTGSSPRPQVLPTHQNWCPSLQRMAFCSFLRGSFNPAIHFCIKYSHLLSVHALGAVFPGTEPVTCFSWYNARISELIASSVILRYSFFHDPQFARILT